MWWEHEVYERRQPWIAILMDFSSHLLFIGILFSWSYLFASAAAAVAARTYPQLAQFSSWFPTAVENMSISYIFIVQWFLNLLVGNGGEEDEKLSWDFLFVERQVRRDYYVSWQQIKFNNKSNWNKGGTTLRWLRAFIIIARNTCAGGKWFSTKYFIVCCKFPVH